MTSSLRAGPAATECRRWWTRSTYLPGTDVVSGLRRRRPHGAVSARTASASADELVVSAVTIGEIQAGVEIARDQDEARAEEMEGWPDGILGTHRVLPVYAPSFRQWARLMHSGSDALSEDAMLAATAAVHGLAVVTRNVRDFDLLGMTDAKQGRGLALARERPHSKVLGVASSAVTSGWVGRPPGFTRPFQHPAPSSVYNSGRDRNRFLAPAVGVIAPTLICPQSPAMRSPPATPIGPPSSEAVSTGVEVDRSAPTLAALDPRLSMAVRQGPA